MVKRRFVVILIFALAMTTTTGGRLLLGADWPQWLGPERTGLSKESGLMKQWPASGPPRVWLIANLGAGYGSISIQGDRIFVQSLIGRQSTVASLNRADGKIIWSRALGPGVYNDRGPGPRGTPTVDGDRLYVLTENGDLACLRTQDGSVLWQRNILRDFNGRNIPWLISESPLVDGNQVIVAPGGRGAGVVALDKMSGETIWTSKQLSDEAGYASVVAADVQGVRTLMTLTAQAGVGIRASDGQLMWRYPRVANRTASTINRSASWDCAASHAGGQSHLNHGSLVPATTATATQDRPATGRSHACAKAKRTLAFDFADSAGIMHLSNSFLGTWPLRQSSEIANRVY